MLASAKRIAKRAIDHSLGEYAWRLMRPPPIDLRGQTDDPITATYLSQGRSFVIEVPMSKCRGMASVGFHFHANTAHPFVRTLKAYADGHCTRFQDSPLARYYEYFQPRSAAAVLALDGDSPLFDLSPIVALPPWSLRNPINVLEVVRGEIERLNRSHGANLDAEHGSQIHGPVSPEKGSLEMARLTRVFDSIRGQGFRRHDGAGGDIRGTMLVSEDRSACFIGTGQHRTAALAALGHTRVPVRFAHVNAPIIVRRTEVDCWPLVRSGLYTQRQALAVFDRIVDGSPPEGAVPPEWEHALEPT